MSAPVWSAAELVLAADAAEQLEGAMPGLLLAWEPAVSPVSPPGRCCVRAVWDIHPAGRHVAVVWASLEGTRWTPLWYVAILKRDELGSPLVPFPGRPSNAPSAARGDSLNHALVAVHVRLRQLLRAELDAAASRKHACGRAWAGLDQAIAFLRAGEATPEDQ